MRIRSDALDSVIEVLMAIVSLLFMLALIGTAGLCFLFGLRSLVSEGIDGDGLYFLHGIGWFALSAAAVLLLSLMRIGTHLVSVVRHSVRTNELLEDIEAELSRQGKSKK